MPTDKLTTCFDEGKRGGERHQGLRRIKPSQELSKEYLKKAIHNFEAVTSFHDTGFSDWSASAAFYTLYQGLLAILAQKGYESRNQSCTFALIEDLIRKEEIKNVTPTDLKEIFDKEFRMEESNKILDLREKMQYGTKTALAESEFQVLKKKTKELFDKIRQELERSEIV